MKQKFTNHLLVAIALIAATLITASSYAGPVTEGLIHTDKDFMTDCVDMVAKEYHEQYGDKIEAMPTVDQYLLGTIIIRGCAYMWLTGTNSFSDYLELECAATSLCAPVPDSLRPAQPDPGTELRI